MTRLELNREFQIFAFEMNTILEKLNIQYYLVTEKYGDVEADFLLESFWDKVSSGVNKLNKAAHSAGKFVGKQVSNVTGKVDNAKKATGEFVDKQVNKANELGDKAKTLINNLSTKVQTYVSNSYKYMLEQPGKFMEKMSGMWSDFKTNLQQLKTTAGENYDKAVDSISESITKKIVEPFIAKWEEYKTSYATHKQKIQEKSAEIKQMGSDFSKSSKENLKAFGKAILKGAENAAFYGLVLIFLPFYGVFKGTNELYKVGNKVVENIKTNAPEMWKQLNVTGEVKAGYAEGKGQQAKVAPVTAPATAPVTNNTSTDNTQKLNESDRQLNFSKDDSKSLLKKYKNPSYAKYKDQIKTVLDKRGVAITETAHIKSFDSFNKNL